MGFHTTNPMNLIQFIGTQASTATWEVTPSKVKTSGRVSMFGMQVSKPDAVKRLILQVFQWF